MTAQSAGQDLPGIRSESVDRILALEDQGVVELGLCVSLAIRVECELLRAIRVRLCPGLPAATEADLWFSPLVQSRDSDSFVLRANIAENLRQRLAVDPRRFQARETILEYHRRSHPALRLEEEVAWLTLTSENDSLADEALLRAVRALERDKRTDLVYWAARALPRLPARVQRLRAAHLLSLASAKHLSGAPLLKSDPPDDFLSNDLNDLILGLPDTPLVVNRSGPALEIGDVGPPGALQVDVPATNPRLVEVCWKDQENIEHTRSVAIPRGATRRVVTGPGPVRLRDARNRVYDIPGEVPQNPTPGGTPIFLVHSSKDKAVAVRFMEVLRAYGYSTLLRDSDPEFGIQGGADWERDLYRKLKLASAVVVLCSPDSMASRWCFAEITQARALGKALFPVVIRPCEVAGSLTNVQLIDMAARGEDEGFRRLLDGLRAAGLDPNDSFGWDPRRPPYPGLLNFDREDAGIFFGRDAEVRHVIELLTRLKLSGESRLAVVVGPSGSGKSSLVRAGVLPRLAKNPEHWVDVAPFRPGADPIGELARAIGSTFPEGPGWPDWRALRDRLLADTKGIALTEAADGLAVALGRRDASVLIVVDQAEELLQGGASGSSFWGILTAAMARPGSRVFALLTLRSDFLGRLQNQPELRGIAFANEPLGLLPVERFPEVIEGPAARAEILLEPGLVASMVADARTDDALPLLAFTLREMYERCRDRAKFSLSVYRDELGGIQGAVARAVERIKAEMAWTPEVHLALRRAFLMLVRLDDEGRFSRQRARWADLPEQAAPVLESFVRARLLTSDGDNIEVTHESLFRTWQDLAGWLDESREYFLWRKKLQFFVNDWLASQRAPDYLLTGGRLAEARRFLAGFGEQMTAEEQEFLRACLLNHDQAEKRSKKRWWRPF